MKRSIVSLAVLLAAALWGCDTMRASDALAGSGVSKTETRPIQEVDAVEFAIAGRLEITVGELQPVEITADDNILPLLATEVNNRTLVIKARKSVQPKVPIVIKVTVPDMKRVSCTGAGRITLAGVSNEQLRLELSGAADMVASGKTGALTIDLAGAATVAAVELQARAVDVNLTGTGVATVHAAEKLDVTITGAGTVRYAGDPKITRRITGIGTLSKID